MIERLASFLRVDDRGNAVLVSGVMPDETMLRLLKETLQSRPSARRVGEGMAITVPVSVGEWYIWVLDGVPSVTELAALMPRLQDLSKGIFATLVPVRAAPSAAVTDAPPQTEKALDAPLIARLNARIGERTAPKAEALAKILLDDLVAQGSVEGATFLQWAGGRLKAVWPSDLRYRGQVDQIGLVADAARQDKRRSGVIPADGADEQDLELALLARQAEAGNLGLVLPARGENGYGLVAFGTRPAALPAIETAVDLLSFSARVPTVAIEARRKTRKRILAGVGAALALFLLWPAPLIISTTGNTMGADVTVVALPAEAYLRQMAVRVGDEVKKGDLIGEFFSPSLENAISETELSASVERLNAQTALAKNDYAAYQLAAQRFEIGKKQLENLSHRKETLTLRAPAAGRIISALSSTITGKYTPVGEAAASIQTSDGMLVEVVLTRMDARFVTQGMTGSVYFRGLGGESFGLEVITPATVSYRPDTGEQVITALAKVTNGNQDQLIVGMAGFARLEGDTVPRIVSYGRYAGEFIREKAWTYLGLNF